MGTDSKEDCKYYDVKAIVKVMAFVVLFGVGLFLRAPDILPPRFWAEDLSQFISDYLAYGTDSIFRSYAGYLHLVPRLTSVALALIPIEWAAWWFTIVAAVFTLWSASILMRSVGRGLGSMVSGSSLLFAHGWSEPLGSVTNLQWIMAPALLSLLLNAAPFGRRESIPFIVLASLSGPFSAAFGPIVAVLVLVKWMTLRRVNLEALVSGICGVVQIANIFMSASASQSQDPEPLWLVHRILLLPFSLSPWPWVAIGFFCVTILKGADRWFRVGVIFGILSLTGIVAFKFHHEPKIFESGLVAQRYWYVQGVLWMVIGASALNEKSSLMKLAGAVGLILMMWSLPDEKLKRDWPWITRDWHDFVMEAREGETRFEYAPGWQMNLNFSK